MGDEIAERKRMLRAELRERRQVMPEHLREAKTASLTERLQQLVTELDAHSLSCFLPTSTEPNVRPFINWAEARGIRVLFPVTRDDGLLDWTVGEGNDEFLGLAGMPEAAGDLLGPIAVNDVDLILVPAAAVDQHGLRLGWGRGYYDKTLGSMEHRPPVYAVVFDHEVLDEVPRERHDQPVDGAVTELRTLHFDSSEHAKHPKAQ